MEKITAGRRAPFGANPEVGDAGRATQQRIITAANELFAELGYARTSVEAITDRAGCSRPTFYQYFAGKEDLHRKIAGQLGTALGDLLSKLDRITPDDTGRDALARWLEGLTDVYAEFHAAANGFTAATRTDEQLISGAAALSERYQETLLAAIKRPRSRALEALVAVINSTAFGACVYRDRIGNVSAERLSGALADVAHRSLFGPIPGVNLGPLVAGPARRVPRLPALDHGGEARRQRGTETRERLLTSAMKAFTMLGYEGVRVDDIATEAGVSHGSFYRYFADKDAIFSALAAQSTEAVTELLNELPSSSSAEWMGRYFAAYTDFGGVISSLPEARTAGVESATTARAITTEALTRVLNTRSFGDVEADVVIAFALLETVPAAAHRSGGLTVEQAAAAAGIALSRGLFGQEM